MLIVVLSIHDLTATWNLTITQGENIPGKHIFDTILSIQNEKHRLVTQSQWLKISDFTERQIRDSAFVKFREQLCAFIDGQLGLAQHGDNSDATPSSDIIATKKVMLSFNSFVYALILMHCFCNCR